MKMHDTRNHHTRHPGSPHTNNSGKGNAAALGSERAGGADGSRAPAHAHSQGGERAPGQDRDDGHSHEHAHNHAHSHTHDGQHAHSHEPDNAASPGMDKHKLKAVLSYMKEHNHEHAKELRGLIVAIEHLNADEILDLIESGARSIEAAAEQIGRALELLEEL